MKRVRSAVFSTVPRSSKRRFSSPAVTIFVPSPLAENTWTSSSPTRSARCRRPHANTPARSSAPRPPTTTRRQTSREIDRHRARAGLLNMDPRGVRRLGAVPPGAGHRLRGAGLGLRRRGHLDDRQRPGATCPSSSAAPRSRRSGCVTPFTEKLQARQLRPHRARRRLRRRRHEHHRRAATATTTSSTARSVHHQRRATPTSTRVFCHARQRKRHKGITCFVVEGRPKGLTAGKHENKMGQRASTP